MGLRTLANLYRYLHTEIEFKYQELMWLERNRQLQSMQNPSPDFRWARTAEPYPKGLDRYMNIQPWGNNRIKLQVPEGYVNYINASPITVAPTAPRDETSPATDTEPDRFIAMQGPKQATTDHVWRMIVEQVENPGVIVMLTETYESNQEKCFQYFPRRKEDPPLEINGHDEFGDGFLATVRCEEIEETPAGDAIQLRKLVVQVLARANKSTAGGTNGMSTNNGLAGIATPEPSAPDQGDLDVNMKSPVAATAKGATQADSDSGGLPAADTPPPEEEDSQRRNAAEVEELVIWHLLFKEWPDYGVPTLANIENFFTLMRLSREKNTRPGNPRIVHCSAGVGRSGTFIALDHLIQELNAGAFEHYDEKMAATRSGGTEMEAENGESEGDDSEGPSKGDEVDDPIYNTVNQLREQRRTMVQSESQYLFIYQVMRKLWQDKYGRSEETEVGEPAAKRLEVDPFVGGGHPH